MGFAYNLFVYGSKVVKWFYYSREERFLIYFAALKQIKLFKLY